MSFIEYKFFRFISFGMNIFFLKEERIEDITGMSY